MPFYDRFVDNTLSRLGYTKATQQPITTFFAGEAPATPTFDFGKMTEEQYERLAVTSSWVYSDIKEIGNIATSAGFGVYEKSGEKETEIVDHEFERLFPRPNPFMGEAFLLQYTLWWWLLRGEAYWWKVFNTAGELVQLWPMPASRMEPIPDATRFISDFKYYPLQGRQPKTLSVEQVVYFRFPNPFDYHRGLSPITAYRLALQTDTSAATWNKDTFNNEVTLRTLLSVPADTPQSTYEVRKAELIEQLQEQKKRFMIARMGDIKAEALSIAPKDLEFLAGRAFNRDEIDRVYGFPAGYWSEKSNRANAENAKASLIDGAVYPLLTATGDEITAQIIKPLYGDNLIGKFQDIRIKDKELEVKEANQYWQVAKFDEARAERGQDEYDGPLADIGIGGLPVPLATNPQFMTAFMTAMMPKPEPPQPETPPPAGNAPDVEEPPDESEIDYNEPGQPDTMTAEATGDLKKWGGICKRRLKNGEVAAYDFESDTIPAGMHADILEALKSVTTEEEVKAVFAAPFPAWESYP